MTHFNALQAILEILWAIFKNFLSFTRVSTRKLQFKKKLKITQEEWLRDYWTLEHKWFTHSLASSDFHGHRPAVYINQHFCGLWSARSSSLSRAVHPASPVLLSISTNTFCGLWSARSSSLFFAWPASRIALECLSAWAWARRTSHRTAAARARVNKKK